MHCQVEQCLIQTEKASSGDVDSTLHVQGNWQLAEQLFQQLEAESRLAERAAQAAASQTASPSSLNAYSVDWASSQAQTDAASGWEQQQAVISMSAMTAAADPAALSVNTAVPEVDDRRLSSGSFGDMPTHLAEQVRNPLLYLPFLRLETTCVI